MKRKATKTVLFSLLAVMLILGCKNAFHEPEYNPSDPIVSDGKSYTVIFNRNGGSGTAPDPINWESGRSINLPYQGGLSRTNYTFSGWNTNASGTGTTFAAGASFTVPNQDVTLYAKWEAVDANQNGTDNNQGGSGTTAGGIDSVSGLINKLVWLQSNAQSGGNYTVEVSSNENIGCQTLSYSGKSNVTITLKSKDTVRTVNLTGDGSMFTISSGVNLILENITLRGHSSNTYSLVSVMSGGTLEMNRGATITGNTILSGSGGSGVLVFGTFIMNDGSITGNTTFSGGGGVLVPGTFTMKGGSISGNTGDFGGGVYAISTFTLENGSITGNTASTSGGGVYTNGTFSMKGGTISNNNAFENGGGVSILESATFNKTGGTIAGYEDDKTNGNIVKNSSGTVLSAYGHAVYVYNNGKRRESTAGSGVNLSWANKSGTGAWDN